MDVLYLLVPLSVVLVFFVLGALGWAIWRPVRGHRARRPANFRERLISINVSILQSRILRRG